MTKEELKGKKIAILGMGIEGISLVTFLKTQGADITILNQKQETELEKSEQEEIGKLGVKTLFGEHAFSDMSSFQVIFRSPGIKPSLPVLVEAGKKGAVVTSQTQLFFDLCPCPIIGVTGTKGKGTTSSLICEMLKKQGFDAYLGGNIGTPPLSFLEKLTPDSKVLLEMSSFQLQDLKNSPHISVMLMTTSEHLDYHKDVYEYISAKRNIFRFQTPNDFAIVNKDYPASNESDIETVAKVYKVSRIQEVKEGCFVKGDEIILKMNDVEEKVIDTKDILLPGRHNLENVCAAVMAAILAGAKIKAITETLKTFKGLEHRLELIKVVSGVKYYDDSFSTTPETAIAAIEAFEDPEILILGGSSKNSDFTELGKIISATENIKAIIGIGLEWEKIKAQINPALIGVKTQNTKFEIIEGCQNMEEIISAASKIATLGDVVLLSPACASFGMFKNYKDRGNQFQEEVNKL